MPKSESETTRSRDEDGRPSRETLEKNLRRAMRERDVAESDLRAMMAVREAERARDAAFAAMRELLQVTSSLRADCSRLTSELIAERDRVDELRARLEPDH